MAECPPRQGIKKDKEIFRDDLFCSMNPENPTGESVNVICHQIDLICHHGLIRVRVGSTSHTQYQGAGMECYSGGKGKKRFDVCLFRMTLFFPRVTEFG